jgi:GT2 family glycosyltransferase
MMDVSLIIVNRNTKELLLDCIDSVYRTLPPLSFEVWVVDNASSDGSVPAVNARFPEVRCLQNERNQGFARANNQAIHQASGRYFVLLNSDTVLTPSALSILVGYLDLNREVAICGGQLLNEDGSLQNSIANFPTLATELLNKSVLRRLFPQRYPGKERRFEQPVQVESIIGACMVLRREAVLSFGMLDEAYFFYLEETDLCLTMKKNGMKVVFHPQARIYHLQGQTAKKQAPEARIEFWRSRYLFFRKNYPPAAEVFLKVGLLAKLSISLLLQGAGAPFSGKSRNRGAINLRILRWHLAGRPVGWGIAPVE